MDILRLLERKIRVYIIASVSLIFYEDKLVIYILAGQLPSHRLINKLWLTHYVNKQFYHTGIYSILRCLCWATRYLCAFLV